jgi:hypothetical protein
VFHLSWKRRKRNPIRQDWHAELPSEKSRAFAYALAQTRPAYVIFSMALDEAIVLRKSGKLEMARDQADVSAELCSRFANALECLLDVVERHADNFGLLPSVNPLNPLFFVGDTARRAATMNTILSTVLFRQRTCFLHKVRTLGEIAAKTAAEYRQMTAEVSQRISNSTGWDLLKAMQYDLTTSLSEATVILKSFIVSLPPGESEPFCERLAVALAASQPASQPLPVAIPAVTDRLAPAFRRE